jgi:hypothetical protein
MNLDEYEMEDELSIIIDDLMGKYDQEDKGHLSVAEFEKLVKDNAKHTAIQRTRLPTCWGLLDPKRTGRSIELNFMDCASLRF